MSCLLKNSSWMPSDSHKTVPAPDRLILSHLNSRMARTKVTPKKGKEEHVWKVKARAQVHMKLAPPVPVDHPAPVLETPPGQEELNKIIEEEE